MSMIQGPLAPAATRAPALLPMPPLTIGSVVVDPPLIMAPMAGITDRPFRILCRTMGAGLAVSEMTSADASLRHTAKSRLRRDHQGEPGPIAVQIAGYDPQMMAEAARFNVEHGAELIDINLGCPAKKVCRVDSGSALMRDPQRVAAICAAVVAAVAVPVTLKMRTGWSMQFRNAVEIARIAEDAGIAALTVHGRTREQRYEGRAEHDTLAEVCRAVSIPVIANGDIDGSARAADVQRGSGCAGIMVGRAALGRPWLFRELAAAMGGLPIPPPPDASERGAVLLAHVEALHVFYGERAGLRVARKHLQWALDAEPRGAEFWPELARIDDAQAQRLAVRRVFDQLAQRAGPAAAGFQ